MITGKAKVDIKKVPKQSEDKPKDPPKDEQNNKPKDPPKDEQNDKPKDPPKDEQNDKPKDPPKDEQEDKPKDPPKDEQEQEDKPKDPPKNEQKDESEEETDDESGSNNDDINKDAKLEITSEILDNDRVKIMATVKDAKDPQGNWKITFHDEETRTYDEKHGATVEDIFSTKEISEKVVSVTVEFDGKDADDQKISLKETKEIELKRGRYCCINDRSYQDT